MYELMENYMLDIFDDTETTERFFKTIYHSTPLNADDKSCQNGIREDCLNLLNSEFSTKIPSIESHELAWLQHFSVTLGFVDNVWVDEKYRGAGIGSKMVNMLARFRNTVDFIFLQSYPSQAFEEIRRKHPGFESENRYINSSEGRKLISDAQRGIDNFYINLGYSKFKCDGFTWMAIDSQRLKKINREARVEAGSYCKNDFSKTR